MTAGRHGYLPAAKLLRSPATGPLSKALKRYSPNYDRVFEEATTRLQKAGHATPYDLAALIGWKHVQNSPWMFRLYDLPPGVVELATEAAFADGLTDAERIQALDPLPGFGAGKAFASVLLAAWDPATYGVFDKFVNETRPSLTRAACTCPWDRLPIYFVLPPAGQ